MSKVSKILQQMQEGDSAAADRLLPLVYEELRSIARRRMAEQPGEQTLDPTGLVHEVYLRMLHPSGNADLADRQWQDRAHFLRASAVAMRHILVDSARKRNSEKRGGGQRPQLLTDQEDAKSEPVDYWLLLDESLESLANDDPMAAQIAQARLFAGMTIEEAAQALGISRATGFRHWVYARARLRMYLRDNDPTAAES